MIMIHKIFSKHIEKGASLMSLVCIASLSPVIASGADFYVDASGNGDGSSPESALPTIRAAFDLAGEGDTILVRGGADRSYMVASEGDLVVVPASNITLRSYGGEGPAKVVISETLSTVTNNASVILVPTNATCFTMSGFDVTYYGDGGDKKAASSLGHQGRVVEVLGNNATIEDCTFRQVGDYSTKLVQNYSNDIMGQLAVGTCAKEHTKVGYDFTVRRCRFLGESNDRSMVATRQGMSSVFSENVFSNCFIFTAPVKNGSTTVLFSSNVFYRCNSFRSYWSYSEFQAAEFAYNIFFSEAERSESFINKNGQHSGGAGGLNGDKVFIHHNTLVNAAHLACIGDSGNINWQPQFFDNLIVLDPTLNAADATVFWNEQEAFKSGNFSSFKTGGKGCLKNNAWYAPGGISGGVATNVPGYDLSKGCAITNNIVLGEWPTFMSMDLGSPNFMRPRASRNPTWATRGVAWTNAVSGCKTGLCDYIGAVEPLASSPLIINLR